MAHKYVVSGCLAGLPCRWDAQRKPDRRVLELVRQGLCVVVCPEVLGGLLPVRKPCERRGKLVLAEDGSDFTRAYTTGAQRALAMAQRAGADSAILKSRSPSCGAGRIYDGSFTHTLCDGDGIFAELLRQAGFRLFSEEAFPDDA